MKAYPVPVRLAILVAVDRGMSVNHAARVFGVGRSTVKRYRAQRRATGTVRPKPHPGRAPLILPSQHADVLALVTAQPGWTLQAYCRSWQASSGRAVSVTTMSRTLRRMGLRRRG